MTNPYATSSMKILTPAGWRTVGDPDSPVFILTPAGWRPFPASGQPIKMLTAAGFATVVPGF